MKLFIDLNILNILFQISSIFIYIFFFKWIFGCFYMTIFIFIGIFASSITFFIICHVKFSQNCFHRENQMHSSR